MRILDPKLLTPREQHMFEYSHLSNPVWESLQKDVRELLTTICELRRESRSLTLRVPSLFDHVPEVLGVMQLGNGVDVVGVPEITAVLLEKINNQRYARALVHVIDRTGGIATLPGGVAVHKEKLAVPMLHKIVEAYQVFRKAADRTKAEVERICNGGHNMDQGVHDATSKASNNFEVVMKEAETYLASVQVEEQKPKQPWPTVPTLKFSVVSLDQQNVQPRIATAPTTIILQQASAGVTWDGEMKLKTDNESLVKEFDSAARSGATLDVALQFTAPPAKVCKHCGEVVEMHVGAWVHKGTTLVHCTSKAAEPTGE